MRDAARARRRQAPRRRRPGAALLPGDEGGWTLAELMVVTSIIVVLAGIAAPQFSRIATQMRTQAAAAQILSDVSWARNMSLRTGMGHYVDVTGDPAIIYEVRRADPLLDPDPILRNVDLSTKMPGVTFTLNGVAEDPYGGVVAAPTPGQLLFDTRGLPAAPGTFFIASEDGGTAFAISITGAGRTRIWRRGNGAWK